MRFMAAAVLCSACLSLSAQKLEINELEYFETTGVNVLVYSNRYAGIFCDEKTAGIELIQRGVRTATGGGVRLMNTPEQWDIYPEIVNRKVDAASQTITVDFRYPDYDYDFSIRVTQKEKGFTMTVNMKKPLPEKLQGKAGLNLEFFPATFMGKTYLIDGQSEFFPHYPSSTTAMKPNSEKITQFFGLSTFDDRGRSEFIVPAPLVKGKTLVLAPEDDDLRVLFKSDTEIALFDGRNLSQNGTFVVRSFIPTGKTGDVLQWYVEPSYNPTWIRKPNIGFSQIGYTPAQKKVSVVELDKNDKIPATAKIFKIGEDGKSTLVLQPAVKEWGEFNKRYKYAKIDFSSVTAPGTYYIEYNGEKTNPFPINKNVYDGKWHNTMDVWLPVQMDHMEVNEAYRVWHGRSHMDDAIQAPLNYEMHDGYRMGNQNYTKYKDYEHIPGLTVGAWYDAGDFDIQAGTVIGLTSGLSDLWERFRPERDETYIDQKTQFVDIHRPDGMPDMVQQVEHGALNLCAQVENIGFVAQGIVQGNMHQYHHLGDAVNITDGYDYDPTLAPYQVKADKYSGTRDDRYAFTGNGGNPASTMSTITSLAEAARVLKPYKPETAERCMKNAMKLWNEYEEFIKSGNTAQNTGSDRNRRNNNFGDVRVSAAIQLWLTTGEQKYKDIFMPVVLSQLEPSAAPAATAQRNNADFGGGNFNRGGGRANLSTALALYPYMDKTFQDKVKALVPAYVESAAQVMEQNPYGVPVSGRTWGGNESVISWALSNYMVWRYFPDMIDPEMVLSGLNFLYGCHPYSNVSFVTSVGVNAKKVAYGNNRADYTVIPGGIVPGIVQLNPDFFEHKDDYPFLWGENECCTRTVPSFVSLSIACEQVAAAINK